MITKKYDYKTIMLHKKDDEIIIQPVGESEKYFNADMCLDIFILVDAKSEPEIFYVAVTRAFGLWRSQKPNDSQKKSAMVRFLGYKNEKEIMKNFKYVSFQWNKDDGYYIIPTKNKDKEGYEFLMDKKILVGKEININNIKSYIIQAFDLS